MQGAQSINMHSFDGNPVAEEYYVHMIPRMKGDLEHNDAIYGMIERYDLTD